MKGKTHIATGKMNNSLKLQKIELYKIPGVTEGVANTVLCRVGCLVQRRAVLGEVCSVAREKNCV